MEDFHREVTFKLGVNDGQLFREGRKINPGRRHSLSKGPEVGKGAHVVRCGEDEVLRKLYGMDE